MTNDVLTRLHVSHALGERSIRVACFIFEHFDNTLGLLDEQPTAVIEALIDHAKDKVRQEHRRSRKETLKAFIKYGEATLEEARTRERRLLYGITGQPQDASLVGHELPHRPIGNEEPIDEDR